MALIGHKGAIAIKLANGISHAYLANTVIWNLDLNSDILDITPLGINFKKQMKDTVGATGNLQFVYRSVDNIKDTISFIEATHSPQVYVDMQLFFTTHIFLSFSAVFTKAPIIQSAEDYVKGSANFEVSGLIVIGDSSKQAVWDGVTVNVTTSAWSAST
jgi:hypothetical protein